MWWYVWISFQSGPSKEPFRIVADQRDLGRVSIGGFGIGAGSLACFLHFYGQAPRDGSIMMIVRCEREEIY